jgi:hypothetical protein
MPQLQYNQVGYWQLRSQETTVLINTIFNRFDSNINNYQQVDALVASKVQSLKLSLTELIFDNKNITDVDIINLSKNFDKNLDGIVDDDLNIIDANLKQ